MTRLFCESAFETQPPAPPLAPVFAKHRALSKLGALFPLRPMPSRDRREGCNAVFLAPTPAAVWREFLKGEEGGKGIWYSYGCLPYSRLIVSIDRLFERGVIFGGVESKDW